MPYKGQTAGKIGHSDLVKNPDVSSFISECEYIKRPTDSEATDICALFLPAPKGDFLPSQVIASDASPYSEPIIDEFPSTQISYVKMSMILINVKDYNNLMEPGTRFVDPFKVAQLHRNADSIAFTLPGSNIRYKKASTVQNGFRRAVYEQLSDLRTSMSSSEGYKVIDTLFILEEGEIHLDKCPSCGKQQHIKFSPNNPLIQCQLCPEEIYATDILRLHEDIADFGSNRSPVTRFMNVVEHLVIANLVRMLADCNPLALADIAFIIDGPLAIFGQPAKISSRLMSFYFKIEQKLINKGISSCPLIIGLQKDGQVMEHARSLSKFIENGSYRVVDDEYRQQYIKSIVSNTENFGHETYYGQDFIFKTENGQIFCVALPYPFHSKEPKKDFAFMKTQPNKYEAKLAKAFDLIRHFEFDLYESSVVPIALARRQGFRSCYEKRFNKIVAKRKIDLNTVTCGQSS
jgi:hypothetical protein